MYLVAIAGPDVFEAALAAASAPAAPRATASGGMRAPLTAALRGRADEAWSVILKALKTTYERGRDAVDLALQSAIAAVEELLRDAGDQAAALCQDLLDRLQRYTQSFIDNALKALPSSINLGDSTYGVTTIKCSRKVVLSGALKASLAEVLSLTASGELDVAIEYGPSPAAR